MSNTEAIGRYIKNLDESEGLREILEFLLDEIRLLKSKIDSLESESMNNE
jgi:hypothetical protein